MKPPVLFSENRRFVPVTDDEGNLISFQPAPKTTLPVNKRVGPGLRGKVVSNGSWWGRGVIRFVT